MANYKKALLSKAKRKPTHRHLRGVCSWNAKGNRWLSQEKLDDSNLTEKLFEQNSKFGRRCKVPNTADIQIWENEGLKGTDIVFEFIGFEDTLHPQFSSLLFRSLPAPESQSGYRSGVNLTSSQTDSAWSSSTDWAPLCILVKNRIVGPRDPFKPLPYIDIKIIFP